MNVGKILISSDVLLSYFQLVEGHIWSSKYDLEHDCVEFIIEHPEMPKQENGIEEVSLVFTTYQDALGHKVSIREPINGI